VLSDALAFLGCRWCSVWITLTTGSSMAEVEGGHAWPMLRAARPCTPRTVGNHY